MNVLCVCVSVCINITCQLLVFELSEPLIKYYDFKLAPAHFNGHLTRNLQPKLYKSMLGSWLGLAWLDWCFVNQSNAKIGNHFINATTAHRCDAGEHYPSIYYIFTYTYMCVCIVYRRVWWIKNGVLSFRLLCAGTSNDVRLLRLDYRSFIDIRHQSFNQKFFFFLIGLVTHMYLIHFIPHWLSECASATI